MKSMTRCLGLWPWLGQACGRWSATSSKTEPASGLASSVYKRMMSSTATAEAEAAANKPGPLSVVLFVPSAVCGFLAYWQWERSDWKEKLIEERIRLLRGEPRSVYELDEFQDYTKVSCSGQYLHDRSIFVGPRPRSVPGYGVNSGYFLITPLYDPVRRGAVLVNRGWVPATWFDDIGKVSTAYDAQPAGGEGQPPAADKAATASKEKAGGWWGSKKSSSKQAGAGKSAATASPTVELVGVLQPSEQPSAVIPDNIISKLEFHWVDVPALATAVGLPPDTPLVQTISDDPATQQQQHQQKNVMNRSRDLLMREGPEYPIPKNTSDLVHFTTMPKDHLIYCGTWVTLCAVLAMMAVQVLRKPPKTIKFVGQSNNVEAWKARHASAGP